MNLMGADFWSPVLLSLKVSAAAGLLVLAAGVWVARIMAGARFSGKVALETLFLLPLILPPSVVGFLLIIIFGSGSPVGRAWEWIFQQPVMFTWWAAVIAAFVVSFPLMYQSAKAGFEGVDSSIEDAARVDGAGELRVFFSITLPLSFKSIVAGAILSFARALGEFGATLMFAGNIPGKTQTAPTAIYMAMEAGNMELAWKWAGVTIVISALMLLLLKRVQAP